jgi:hypothetical protein
MCSKVRIYFIFNVVKSSQRGAVILETIKRYFRQINKDTFGGSKNIFLTDQKRYFRQIDKYIFKGSKIYFRRIKKDIFDGSKLTQWLLGLQDSIQGSIL